MSFPLVFASNHLYMLMLVSRSCYALWCIHQQRSLSRNIHIGLHKFVYASLLNWHHTFLVQLALSAECVLFVWKENCTNGPSFHLSTLSHMLCIITFTTMLQHVKDFWCISYQSGAILMFSIQLYNWRNTVTCKWYIGQYVHLCMYSMTSVCIITLFYCDSVWHSRCSFLEYTCNYAHEIHVKYTHTCTRTSTNVF